MDSYKHRYFGEPFEDKDVVNKHYMDTNVQSSEINHRVIVEPDEIVCAVNKENINHYTTTLLVALPTSRTDKSFEIQNRRT